MKKRACTAILAAFAVAAGLLIRPAAAATMLEADELRCDYAYAYCIDTGDVIMDKNARERTAMASLTKIMTALVTVETCADLDAEITVSEQAIAATPALSSTADLIVGERMTVRDMLYCMMLPSGNDAANVLAEHCGGSIEAFVELMNRRAGELGCEDTQFQNPHGFDEDGHYSTAADIATILSAALKNPEFEKVFTTFSYVVPRTNMSEERALQSTNRMTDYTAEAYSPSITGTKTGFTGNAGYCLACTGQVGDGPAFISVVLGGEYPDGASVPDSYLDTAYLLETATERYRIQTLHSQGDPLGELEVDCLRGGDSVGLQAQDDLSVLIDSELAGRGVTASLTLAKLAPPFYERQRVGTVVYTDADGAVLAEGGVVTTAAGEYSHWKGFWKALGDIPAWQYVCIVLGAAVLAFVLLLLVQALRRRIKRYYRRRGMLPHSPAAGAKGPEQGRRAKLLRRRGKTRGSHGRGKPARSRRPAGSVSRLWSDLNSGPTTTATFGAEDAARSRGDAGFGNGRGRTDSATAGTGYAAGGAAGRRVSVSNQTSSQTAPLQTAPSQAAPLQAAPSQAARGPGGRRRALLQGETAPQNAAPVQTERGSERADGAAAAKTGRGTPAEYVWRSAAYRPAGMQTETPARSEPVGQAHGGGPRPVKSETGVEREEAGNPASASAVIAPRPDASEKGAIQPVSAPTQPAPEPEAAAAREPVTELEAAAARESVTESAKERAARHGDAPVQAWDTELLVPFLFDDASAAWQERERRSMRAAVAEGYGDGASGTAVADEPLRRAMDSAPPAVRKRLAAQYSGAVENRRAEPPQRTGTQAEPEAEGGVHPEDAPTRRTEGRVRTDYPRSRRRRRKW